MEPPSSLTSDYYLLVVFVLISALYMLIKVSYRRLLSVRGDRGLLYLISDSDMSTGSLLQLSLIFEILMVTLLSRLFDQRDLLITLPIIFVIIVLLGYVIPALISHKFGAIVDSKVTHKLPRYMALFTYPINAVFIKLSKVLKRTQTDREILSLEEFTEELYEDEEVSSDERELVKDIVEFSITKVNQIMTPRVNVVAISTYSTSSEIKLIALNSGFSRFPVYEKSFDNVIGFLYIKDLVNHLQNNEVEFDWKCHIRPISFVPESKKIRNLLDEMRKNKFHLVMVADEYGGIEGIVTLEDILEEIVGEIVDETD